MTRTPASRLRMAATYAPGTVRVRRWHCAGDVRGWLPPALGLGGPHRPHRHSSHHGPRIAVCCVVAHRDEGITAFSTAPRPFRPGRGGRKNPGAAVAAPGVQCLQQNAISELAAVRYDESYSRVTLNLLPG